MMVCRWMLLIALFCMSFSSPAFAEEQPVQVVIDAVKVEDAPKIDGLLDDKCWENAEEFTNFRDAQNGSICTKQTTAKMCYDESNVYIAFHALHPHPDKIRAQEKKRNGGGFENDDFVGIDIDSNHQHRYLSWFDVNAIGTQAESLECTSTTNIAFKGDWQGAAKIVDDGYTVEMAIPFSLLPYNKNQDTFGIAFVRNMPEEDIWAEWPDLGQRSYTAYYAHLQGLELPKIAAKPKILGYMLGTSGKNETGSTNQGLDIKYPLTASSMGIASINPDFNSIEQDVESIDFSYEEKQLSDSRPFFQEWPLEINDRVFYSRRITDFDTGLKFVGTEGHNGFGVMHTNASGENCTLASVRRHFGDMSGFKINLADHDMPGHRNTVTYYNPWRGWMFGKRSLGISAALLQSSTTGLPDGQLRRIRIDSYGGDRAIGGYIEMIDADATFNSELGYSPDSGRHGVSWGLGRENHYRDRNLNCTSVWMDVSSSDYNSGGLYNRKLSFYFWMGYNDGHSLETGFLQGKHEQLTETLPYFSINWNRNKTNCDGGTGVSFGHEAGGDYLMNWIEQKLRISNRATVGLRAERELIDDPSPYADINRQVWVTLNYDLSNEKSVGGRVVRHDGNSNTYFMYRQQVREGSDIYFMYGDPNADDTQERLTFKIVRSL